MNKHNFTLNYAKEQMIQNLMALDLQMYFHCYRKNNLMPGMHRVLIEKTV